MANNYNEEYKVMMKEYNRLLDRVNYLDNIINYADDDHLDILIEELRNNRNLLNLQIQKIKKIEPMIDRSKLNDKDEPKTITSYIFSLGGLI